MGSASSRTLFCMDDITARVRAFYERFPYPPPGAPEVRVGSDPHLLLSYLERTRPRTKLRVLDAGCGRGRGILANAALHPDVEFVGIDLNRVALEEARSQAEQRRIGNVQFVPVDLMTLEGLDVPDGGFDVVISSGVLHHLSDPRAALSKLRAVLASDGALSFMVYGRHGREALYRVVRAMNLLAPREADVADRLVVLKELIRVGPADVLFSGPWADAAIAHDAEIVDRYLNPNETSYSVLDVLELLDGAGFRFVRFVEPEAWRLESVLPDSMLLEHARGLPPLAQFALVEQLSFQPKLDLVACPTDAALRTRVEGAAIDDARVAAAPDASLVVETRALPSGVRTERVTVRVRRQELALSGPHAVIALRAFESAKPLRGRDFVELLVARGLTRDEARDVVTDLVDTEVCYRPHG